MIMHTEIPNSIVRERLSRFDYESYESHRVPKQSRTSSSRLPCVRLRIDAEYHE